MADASVEEVIKVAKKFMDGTGRDLYIFSGPINAENCDHFINRVLTFKNRRAKAALFLCTYGGDAHAAYRMARVLRRCYSEDLRILIGGYCKSAGTLVALCADSLGFSEVGELGPLDTQISQRDEVMQMASGLEVFSTLQYLTDHAFACFENNMLTIIRRSGQTISTRLASEIASRLAIGLLKPITAQLDPNRIGIAQRGLAVTQSYGRQLAASSRNLQSDAESVVQHLVKDYPTHAFVIDKDEAKTLFKNVDEFSSAEFEMFEQLRSSLTHPNDDGLIVNLSEIVWTQEIENATTDKSSGEAPTNHSGKPSPTKEGRKGNGKPVAESDAGKSRGSDGDAVPA